MVVSNKAWQGVICLLSLFASELVLGAGNDQKTFALTIPFVSLGEGALRGEFNLFSKAALALEWADWSGAASRQELSRKELEKDPKSSFMTEGKHLSLVLGKYSNPSRMSGFNWGVGAGYREMTGLWKTSPTQKEVPLSLVDDDGKVMHNITMKGPTASGRLGYRYVGENWGFAAGGYLGIRKFFPTIADAGGQESGYTPLTLKDRKSLISRMDTKIQIGLELGWAW